MKRNLIVTLAAFATAAPPFCRGDVYVKASWRYEERYHHGNLQPAYDLIQEWWFGDGKVTWIRHGFSNLEGYPILPALRITLDRREKRVIFCRNGGFLESHAKYWIEIPLNADPDACLSRAVIEQLAAFRLEGSVKRLNGRRDREVYEATEILVKESRRILELRQRIQTDARVAFDWRLAGEIHAWVRAFFHPSHAFAKQSATMQGFVLKNASTRGGITAVYRVLEMSSREPPDDVYGVPVGYERRPQLTFGDLNNLLQAVHGISW